MSTDRPEESAPGDPTRPPDSDADQQTVLNEQPPDPSTGAGHPKDLATIENQSDVLVGETVTLSSADTNVIGNFRLTKRLGAGGFGVVYAADDLRLDRRVALKVPFAVQGEGAAAYYRRVIREGRAAAALEHPNIVSIYEVGERNGQPFIVSQLIEGPTLYDRNTSGRMAPREAAALMVVIARALAYAHRKGIIHRDMKPGNILLDEDGVPHVNDFGIAKHDSEEETISSEDSVIGTPAYMSPEQAAGKSRDADCRSDLYSLGVILYELMTGERPFRGSSRMLLHQVVHAEPQPPRQLVQSISRDLETICLKCLEKDPHRRYQTCDELADDLQRFLGGEAIQARPVSRIEHAWRKCRRYPVASALGAALLLSLVAGLAGVTWQWRRAETNRAAEQQARREVERSRQELAERVDYSNRLLYCARMGLAGNSVDTGDYQQADDHLSLSDSGLAKYRDIEYDILRNHVDRYQVLRQHVESVTDIAISDDESIIAASGLRTLLVWDQESGHVLYRAREKGQQLRCVAFAPNSDLLAWGGQSGRIRLTLARTGQMTRTLDHGGGVRAIAFNPDGSQLLSAGDDGKIIIWSVETHKAVETITAHKGPVQGAMFVGADRVISGGQDRCIVLSDVESGESSTLLTAARPVMSVAVSGDGRQFAAGLEHTRLLVGELDEPKRAREFNLYGSYVVDLEFLAANDRLVTSHQSGLIYVWNLPDVRAARQFECVKGFGRFAIARASSRMIVGAGDGTIEAIRLDNAPLDQITVEGNSLIAAILIDDGQSVVACPSRGPAQVFHLASGRLVRRIPNLSDASLPESLRHCAILCVDQSPDGSALAVGTDSGQILIWNTDDGRLKVHGSPDRRGITYVRWVGDGSTLVSGGDDGAIRLWDLRRADASTEITRHGGVIRGLEISPDGRWLAAAAADGSVSRVEVGPWKERNRIDTGQTLQCMAWTPDSSRLAIGDSKGEISLYPSDLAGPPTAYLGHAGPVNCIAFSPRGATMITGGNDDQVRYWDLLTGQTKMIQRVHDRNVRSISLSPGGKLLMTADAGGGMRIWPIQP